VTRLLVFLALVLVVAPGRSLAHEVRPAYLELRQSGPETYDVVWKVPGRGEAERFGIDVVLPAGSVNVTPPRGVFADNAFVERWRVTRAGGMTGGTIAVDGLASTVIDVLVRMERLDGTTQVARLTPWSPSVVVEGTPSRLRVATTYLRLGVEHILFGVDHLLFVLALLILVQGRRRLLATVTAFTLAHSLTLAGATLGLVRVPPRPVEAVIALSIVFVACEIVRGREGRPGLTAERPWVVAFTFGLLHGFGFAGALREVGLPQQAIPVALLFFNVGVEVGQLLFIASVLALAAVARRIERALALPRPAWAWRVPAYAIGTIAAYWTIGRVVLLGN
jgi:hydrogenase/urease accessory protein HupE